MTPGRDPSGHPPTARRVPARAVELTLVALVAAAAAVAAAVLPLPGGDAAAHLYRTALVQHGVLVWDNLWFAGSYPLISYSFVYYLPAALVGNVTLGILSVVLASVLFADILRARWGDAGRWPARSFALVVAGQVFTGAYPFDAGLAAMVASLWALQRRRYGLATFAAAVALGCSPLAFLFLAIGVAGLFLHARVRTPGALLYGAALGLLGGGELLAQAAVGATHLVYPFGLWRFAAGAALALVGLWLSLARRRGSGPLPTVFAVWLAVALVLYLVPTAVGHNLLRSSIFLFPLMLLASTLRNHRPRWLALTAMVASLCAAVLPYASMVEARTSDPLSSPSAWTGTLAFLHRHETADFRIEVVPTTNHWESYYVAGAGFPLARGWYRQLDLADDGQLYGATLTGRGYRAWLRSEGVRYVVVPIGPYEAMDGAREARLLASGAAGLRRVWSGRDASVYELAHATPLITGPGTATITRLDSGAVAGRVARPGRYRVRVHWTTDWRLSGSAGCAEPAPAGMTELVLRHAGSFVLSASQQPIVFIERLLDGRDACEVAR